MHASHEASIAGIELIIGISYVLIALGFALRTILEAKTPALLWPWMLVSIFVLCGLTRLDYIGVIGNGALVLGAFHFLLAAAALAYGIGQLGYAIWPELFEEEPA